MHTKQPKNKALKKAIQFNLYALAEAWPSPIVSRSEVRIFSGGLLNPRTMANLDSLGRGAGKIKIGRRVCYCKYALVDWLEQRLNAGDGEL